MPLSTLRFVTASRASAKPPEHVCAPADVLLLSACFRAVRALFVRLFPGPSLRCASLHFALLLMCTCIVMCTAFGMCIVIVFVPKIFVHTVSQ